MNDLLVIKGKKYINLKDAVEYIKVLDSENHMEKYNIKRFRQRISLLRFNFKKGIERNYNCEYLILKDDLIYIDFDYFKTSVELCLKSIPVKVLVQKIIETSKLGETLSSKNILYKLNNSENLYHIDLFSTTEKFVSVDDFKQILKGHEILVEKDCLTLEEVTNKINNIYHGFTNLKETYIYIIKQHNLETFFDYRYNFIAPGKLLIPSESVDKIISIYNERVKKNMLLINTSFDEYLSLKYSEFNEIYRELTSEDLKKIGIYNSRKSYIYNAFKGTNIKCISLPNKVYVSKKEFKEFEEFKQNYVQASLLFSNEKGIEFNAQVAKNLGIQLVKYKGMYYIRKSDMYIYEKKVKFLKEYNKSESIYERVKLKIEDEPHWKNDMFPEVKELILEYCKNMKSNS